MWRKKRGCVIRFLMEIKHKIWLEKEGRVIFGPGRIDLLRAIDACGNLSAAARELNMSYRAAWGRLRASEKRLGMRLVDLSDNKHEMSLTQEARKLIDCFDQMERKITLVTDAYIKKIP
jgi:molybdate transport system regulatory protein